jgi:predicted HicB family RNase H-like nuclease
MNEKRQEVFRVATELFNQQPDWVAFFREVLGLDGVIRRAFPDPASLSQFEQCAEYLQIQQMLAKLREKTSDSANNSKEPQRVITVRLPKSMHEALKEEAKQHKTSMNKLCISKLLQVVDDELVPAEIGAAQEQVAEAI